MSEEQRTYWLSFCDTDRPTGQQFLGVVLVDVTEADAEWERVIRAMRDQDEGPWIAACITKAWEAKVNPGGEVQTKRMDGRCDAALALYPRLTLLDRAAITALDEQANAVIRAEAEA